MSSNKIKLILVLLVILIGISIAVILYYFGDSYNPYDSEPISGSQSSRVIYDGKEYTYNNNLTNILFLGIDKEEEVSLNDSPGLGGQADCIMILSMDNENETVRLLQISRDSMTEIDIYDTNGNYYTSVTAQLATQYAYGNGADTSCWATKKTVSEFLYDLPISGYISFNIEGVPVANDAVGGVTITVPEDYSHINPVFYKGNTLTLDGVMAEKYIRYRDTDALGGNNDRMKRQVHYLPELISTISNVSDDFNEVYDSLYSVISPYLITDLSIDDLEQLFEYDWMLEDVKYIKGESVAGEKNEEFHVDEKDLQKKIIEMFYKVK